MVTVTEIRDQLVSTTQLALVTLEAAIATGDTTRLPAAQQAVMDGWRIFEDAFAAELTQEMAGNRPPQGAA